MLIVANLFTVNNQLPPNLYVALEGQRYIISCHVYCAKMTTELLNLELNRNKYDKHAVLI